MGGVGLRVGGRLTIVPFMSYTGSLYISRKTAAINRNARSTSAGGGSFYSSYNAEHIGAQLHSVSVELEYEATGRTDTVLLPHLSMTD